MVSSQWNPFSFPILDKHRLPSVRDESRKNTRCIWEILEVHKRGTTREMQEKCTCETKLLEEIGNFRKSLICIPCEIQGAFIALKLEQEVMTKRQFEIREIRLKIKNTIAEVQKCKVKHTSGKL